MAMCMLPQMYIYNMWHVVANQRKHVAANQPISYCKCKADEQCANDNVKLRPV